MELKEVKELGENIKTMLDRISTLETSSEEYKSAIREFKAKAGRFGGGSKEPVTFKSMIADAVKDNYNEIKASQGRKNLDFEIKTGNILSSNALTGTVYQSGVVRDPVRPYFPVHFRDFVPVIPTDTGSVNYPTETDPPGTGSLGYSTEGSDKAQVDYQISMTALTLRFLAGYARVSREMIQDLSFLQNYLAKSLLEDYSVQEDIKIYQAIAAGAITGTTSETLSAAKILDYIATIENSGRRVSALVTSPSGWTTILKTKPNDYSTPGGVQFTPDGGVTIAGYPLIKSPVIPAGKILVGDFNNGVGIAQAEGINLRSTETNQDDFIANLITFRIECRMGIMLLSPKSFVIGNV